MMEDPGAAFRAAYERALVRYGREAADNMRALSERHRGTGMYYARDGREITFLEWTVLWDPADFATNRRVAETVLGAVRVSTVWLGTNLCLPGEVPLIFESMIFGGDLADVMDRYPTEADALRGHAVLVAAVEAASALVAEAEAIVLTAQALVGLDQLDSEGEPVTDLPINPTVLLAASGPVRITTALAPGGEYETAVSGGGLDVTVDRFAARPAAVQGHAEVVGLARMALGARRAHDVVRMAAAAYAILGVASANPAGTASADDAASQLIGLVPAVIARAADPADYPAAAAAVWAAR